MICDPAQKLFLQKNKSKLFKKIKPSRPIRLPVVKPESSAYAEKSKNPQESIFYKSTLFNRIKIPKIRHVSKIKDLTKEFTRNVSEIYFKDLENTTKRTLKQIKSLMSLDSSQKSLKFHKKLFSSQKVFSKIIINPFNHLSDPSFSVKTVNKKVTRSLSPFILKEPRKKIECPFLSISPVRK